MDRRGSPGVGQKREPLEEAIICRLDKIVYALEDIACALEAKGQKQVDEMAGKINKEVREIGAVVPKGGR